MKLKTLIKILQNSPMTVSSDTNRHLCDHFKVDHLTDLIVEKSKETIVAYSWTCAISLVAVVSWIIVVPFFEENREFTLINFVWALSCLVASISTLVVLWRIFDHLLDPQHGKRLQKLKVSLKRIAQHFKEGLELENKEEEILKNILQMPLKPLKALCNDLLVQSAKALVKLEEDNARVPKIMWQTDAEKIKAKFLQIRKDLLELRLIEDEPYGPIFDEARRQLTLEAKETQGS